VAARAAKVSSSEGKIYEAATIMTATKLRRS